MLSHGARSDFKNWILAVFVEYFSHGFIGLLTFVRTHIVKMEERQLFPPPDPLQLLKGNSSHNWRRFKQKWSNYELETGVSGKNDAIWVAIFSTVIGDEALDVYNAFTWTSAEDKVKMDQVLEQFEQFWDPRKNTIYKQYLFFSQGQESGESIDKYATVLRNMADNYEFRDLRDSLILDRIVFGVTDHQVREQLLTRVPDLTLDKALEIARAAKATQSQLKQLQNL